MRVDWKRELTTGAQYLLIAVVASSVALVFQAEARPDPLAGEPGVAVCYDRLMVLKDSGVFYGWLLLLFAGLAAARLLLLWAWRRLPDNFG